MQPTSGRRYEVEWTDPATEDLCSKVDSDRVAQELIDVAKVALNEFIPSDGDQVPPLYWRRGLTPQRRAALDAAAAAGPNCDDTREEAWHYILVYRRRPRRLGRAHGYVVVAVLRNAELIHALLNLETLADR